MSLATAKDGIRTLSMKHKSVIEDTSMTVAEKTAELEKIETALSDFSAEVALFEKSRRLGALMLDEAVQDAKATPESGAKKTWAQQFLDSNDFKSFQAMTKSGVKNQIATEVSVRGFKGLEVGLKAADVVEGAIGAQGFFGGNGGPAVLPDFLPGVVQMLFPKLVIADLFAQGSTDSASLNYLAEAGFTNGAAGTAEGGAYAQSDDTLTRVVEQVGKIAHFMRTSDEMVQDAAQFFSFIQNRLIFGVQLKEDSELLTGSGVPSVNGLLNRTGMQDALTVGTAGTAGSTSPQDVIEALYQQLTNIRFAAFVEPDYIVANPFDWSHIRLAKDDNGQYFGGGPFTGAYGNGLSNYSNVEAIWGKPVVLSPHCPQGTFVVGGFQECGQVFRRQGVTLEMSNSDATNFTTGLVTVRAEERLALAVYRPGGFGKVVAAAW